MLIIILCERLNSSIWPIDETLISTNTPDQSEYESNANKKGTPHSPNFQTGSSPSDAV